MAEALTAAHPAVRCDQVESAATVCFAGWNEWTDFVTDERPPSNFRTKGPKIHLS